MEAHGDRAADRSGGSGSPVAVPVRSDPTTGATDIELLRAHVEGDRDAFAELFHRHRDRLWAVALRTLGDREEAADALQDALLSAHRAAARFRGDSAVTTWLHRIVVNACLDRIRRRQAHPTVPLPDGTRSEDTGRPTGVEPAAPVHDHDTALVVRQALAELPIEQRAALILVDVQGYPVAEVARILGVAEGTVKSRCARGRARLAVLLGHLRTGSGDERPGPATGTSGHRRGAMPPSGVDRPGGGDVPPVTPGNPRPPEGVGSGSGRSRRDASQEDT
ncbi:RNA polymerase sigma factor SigM [Micromonospora sp. ATA32]|nr:RNA polymerase sigma factor SigM [Micromonospora sp. ATA32]